MPFGLDPRWCGGVGLGLARKVVFYGHVLDAAAGGSRRSHRWLEREITRRLVPGAQKPSARACSRIAEAQSFPRNGDKVVRVAPRAAITSMRSRSRAGVTATLRAKAAKASGCRSMNAWSWALTPTVWRSWTIKWRTWRGWRSSSSRQSAP